jgi:hypothetical protein
MGASIRRTAASAAWELTKSARGWAKAIRLGPSESIVSGAQIAYR